MISVGRTLEKQGPALYSPECVEEDFCELRHNGVLRSSFSHLTQSLQEVVHLGDAPSRLLMLASLQWGCATTSHSAPSRSREEQRQEDPVTTVTTIRPFRVDVPEEDLVELRRRIASARWPSKELVEDRSQGVQLATMQELTRYWQTDYDWRKAEAKLSALTDPTAHGGRAEDAFDLVLPSLPGYGFSGEPTELGWDVGRVGQAWAELMRRLGYSRYVAQGGDVGAGVSDAMGRQAPEGLLGIHMSLLVTVLAGPPPAESEQERAATDQLATFRESGFGYFLEMATRPQTIGYALLDTPVALAAWMLDHDTDSYYKIS